MSTPTPQAVALAATYHFRVESDGSHGLKTRYDGTDAADAMAAWSKAISQGTEYVILEALRDRPIVTAKED